MPKKKNHDKYYNDNMATLKKRWPLLHDYIRDESDVDWIEADGNQMLVYQGQRPWLVYPQAEPLKHRDVLFKTTSPLKQNTTIVIGAGLGHSLHKLLKGMEREHTVLLIEPIAKVIKEMFKRYDFSRYIDNGSLIMAVTKGDVAGVIGEIEMSKVVEEWFLIAEPYCYRRVEYIELIDLASQVLNQVRANTGTVMGNGLRIAQNDIECLPYVIRARGVKELEGMFKGKPAICVSTGPSLRDNIHLLHEAKGRALIIAVGQALRPLLAHGIRPDIICAVDFGEVNMTHYAGLLDETIPLATINRTYAPLLAAYKGEKFISAQVDPAFIDNAQGVLKDKGALSQGGSVAHMCLALAHAMGCNPITMIGQDLALGELSHIPLADSGGTVSVDKETNTIQWTVNDVRSPRLHDKTHSMGLLTQVAGYYGGKVDTNIGLASFITSFEQIIEGIGDSAKIYNSTEGGARIWGAEPLSLREYINQYCTEQLDITLPSGDADNADDLTSKAIDAINKDIEVLNTVISEATAGLKIAVELLNTKDKGKIRELFDINSKHSVAAHEAAKKNNLLSIAIYNASRAILGRGMEAPSNIEHLIKHRFDREKRINRNKYILTAAKEAAEQLLTIHEQSLGLLKQGAWVATGETTPPDLSDAESYFERGNWARPMLEAMRYTNNLDADIIIASANKMRELDINRATAIQETKREQRNPELARYEYLIEKAIRLGRKKKYDDSFKLLDEAEALMPDRYEALRGKGTTLFLIGKIDEAKECFEKLIEKTPDNLRNVFEAGLVMVSSGELDKGKELVLRAVHDGKGEFTHFLLRLAEVLLKNNRLEEADSAIKEYLIAYPFDKRADVIQAQITQALGLD